MREPVVNNVHFDTFILSDHKRSFSLAEICVAVKFRGTVTEADVDNVRLAHDDADTNSFAGTTPPGINLDEGEYERLIESIILDNQFPRHVHISYNITCYLVTGKKQFCYFVVTICPFGVSFTVLCCI